MRKKLWILVLLIAGGLQMLQAQSPEQVARLQDLAAQLKQKSQAEKAEAVRVANQKGWPVRTVDENGRITELMRLDEKGMPVYYTTYNANGAALINSDELYTGGAAGLSLSGSGQTLGIWDGGDVRTTHVELTGRITDKDGVSPDGIEDHPTHVAGTMIASGVDAAAKGMSFAASLDAYDWTDDEAEMIAAAADGLNVSQHSYGQIAGWAQGSWSGNYGWHWFGDYTIDESENYFWGYYSNEAQYWDYISQISPNYLIVKSAGNDRGEGITSGAHYAYKYSDGTWVSSSTARLKDGGTTGYQTVAHSATSKNVMTVGAVDNTTAMSSFSGWGPTDDGRIKPDIVAKGVSVYSSLADADNNSYASWNGTSMSGPMVSGSVGLLLEHQENLHPGVTLRSATMKGLILHTATDLGNAGPDYVYGWGLMNTQAAAEVMTDNASGGNHIVETSLSNGATKTYYIEATGGEPVVATIIWTDPYGAVPTPSLNPTDLILVNDLDMQIEDASSTVFNPYILDPANPGNAATTGDNIRDNIEKIVIASPTAGGVYAITISHKATLNGGSQDYSLIITGNTSLSTTTTLPYAETFDTDLGDCYTYSVSGDTKYWEWANFEGNGYARMNGYNSGETEEDWLILPGINADDYTTITMSFETAYNFGTNDADNYLKLFYSTDYIGVGDPNDATWTELAFTQPVAGNYVYVNSGDIDLSAISGQFYLAFKYRGTNGSYRAWQIDNINIFQELITFYFRGPDWMDNNPHNPEVWGPFNGWSTGTMTYDNSLEWWKTTVQVADAAAEITYQSRFAEGGVTKYQKAFGDFGANPTFTTSTGEIWIDASDNASFAWSGNDFYLAQDNITETQPLIAEPANHVTNLAITADSESQISLSWTDSDAAYYLIKGSAVGYADISDPVDGTAEADALLVKNVGSSIQSVSFSGLDAATTYYFKVFPYNGTGSIVNYKTDGTVPQESAATNSLPYYYAGMEGDEETKGSYASGTVTISNVQWDLTEALIGTLASDYKTGIRSVRMRGYGTSAMTMLEDKANGIGSIYFNYRRYGTDAQVDWKVEYSTDGGSNWTQIGSVFTAPDSDEVQTFHEKVNVDGNIRLRIKRETETGTSNRRLNIDDIIVTSYNTIGLLADISDFSAFDVTADQLYASGTLFNPIWPEPGSNGDAEFSRLDSTNLLINIFNITYGAYSYKYFKNSGWSNGEWTGDPNRSRSLTAGDLVKDIVSYVNFTGNGNISTLANWQASAIPSERNVIVYGDATVDQSFSALDLIIEDGASVTAQAGEQLTVSNTLTNNAGTAALFLQSDATGTASLLHHTDNVDMTIQRYLTGDANTANAKYHTVSVPLTAASNPQTGLFMGSYLYRFDFASQDYVSMGTSTTTPMNVDEGYLLYYPDANITYDFAGKANNGSFAAAVNYGVGDHYNLVPNPYPSAIDWDANPGWTKTNVNNAIYIYNTALSSNGNPLWASYVDGVAGANGGSQYIPAGQAFFVQANAADPVLEMTNDVRVHNAQPFYKESKEESETLRLFAHADEYTDESVVCFIEASSYDFDGQYDALKFKNWSAAPNIYSLTPDKTELSINSIPYSTETYLMEVGFEWNGSGEAAIEVQGIESFGEWVTIFLEDLLTGARIDLHDQNTYTFIHEADNDPLRFALRFMGVTGADELSNAENDIRIWSADRMLHLSHFGKVPTLVEVFDLQGRLLYSEKLNGKSSTSVGELPLDQVLIVRLSSNESVRNQKVIIR